ncbi:hypothetical protein GC173_13580 [bacterium]|nr:hypothetical protein [bacterium]
MIACHRTPRFSALPFLTLLLISVSPLGAQTISGRVTNASTGNGILGVDLDVIDSNGASVAITGGRTTTNGVYTITGIDPGTYRVRADASLALGFADEYYSEQFLPSLATPVTVAAGGTAANINFTLVNGFEITGTVTGDGVPLSGIDMDVYASNGEFLGSYPGTTDASGVYRVGALPPGSYYVRANPDPAAGQFYTTRYIGGAATLASATPVTITNASLTGQNIALTGGGTLSGTVTQQGPGTPLVGIDLDLFDASTSTIIPVNATTRVDGTYSFPVLPAGTYRLRIDPTLAQRYPRTYYPDSYSLSTAGTVTVANNAATSGINFSVPQAGSISGTIREEGTLTPLAAIDLDCYDALDQRVDVTTVSAADGTYVIGPLAPGIYHLRADATLQQGYLLQYYNLKPTLSTADAITVTAGMATPAIDFTLGKAGWIEGTVLAAGGTPLEGIDLDVYTAADGLRIPFGTATRADGTYLIGPIPIGTYKMRCDPTVAQAFAVEYWDAKPRLAEADTFVVAQGIGTLGLNFTLEPGGSLSGTIRSAADNSPLADIDIDLYIDGTLVKLDQSAKTAADGTFTVGPVPPGNYRLRADAPVASNYIDLYYPAAPDLATAQTITVNAGAITQGIDLRLVDRTLTSNFWIIR